MKKIIAVLYIFLLVSTVTFAQNDTLINVKSINKVYIGGHPYYVHIVKKGETLFSLSELYEISQKDLAKENPEIFLGLQIGQALKIPIIHSQQEEGKIKEEDFIYHRVKKGQTLYSLSRKYDIAQEDIITCNPSVRYGINVDQIIKIPKSKEVVTALQAVPENKELKDTIKIDDNFIYHKVQARETVFSLTRKYEITEDILKEHNPFVTEGLKTGQVLKIPKVVNPEMESVMFVTEKKDTTEAKLEQGRFQAYSDSVNYTRCFKQKLQQSEPYEISIMLPFYLTKNDEEFYIDSSEVDDFGEKIYEKIYYEPHYIYPRSLSFIEFYEGFLLAVDSLKRNGLSINLHVYDTENDTNRVKEILSFPEIKNTDLIIGPIYNHEIELVSEFSRNYQIKMVTPLSDELRFADENPMLFQVYPSFNAQIEEYAKYISNFQDKNIVLVHNGDSLGYHNIQQVKERIFSYLSVDTNLNSIQFKEVAFKDSINALQHALSKETENIFVIPSNDEAFVTDVITNLNTLKTFGNQIKVIGLSRWQRFNNIDPEYFFNLELSIATPFFIDYHNHDVKNFILKYRHEYNTEPDQMAVHGYDIGLFFLSALQFYGYDFENCIYQHSSSLLQANYKFVKWYQNSGYENIDVSMVKYFGDYHIDRIKNQELNNKEFSQADL